MKVWIMEGALIFWNSDLERIEKDIPLSSFKVTKAKLKHGHAHVTGSRDNLFHLLYCISQTYDVELI